MPRWVDEDSVRIFWVPDSGADPTDLTSFLAPITGFNVDTYQPPRRPTWDEVVTEGQRIVSWAIIIALTFLCLSWLLVTSIPEAERPCLQGEECWEGPVPQ